MEVYFNRTDPWTLMKNVRKLSKQLVEEKTVEWTTEGVLGFLADDMSGEKEEQSENDKDKRIRPAELFTTLMDSVLPMGCKR